VRHIGFGNRGGYERLWLGRRSTTHYQEEALAEDATYRREVAMAAEIEHRGWQVRVQGRIDGPAQTRGRHAGRRGDQVGCARGGQLSAVQREIYERQALLYAWMCRRRSPRPRSPRSWC
jgi:hypothetical protein